MAHAYGGIGLCRSLSLPPLSRSLPLPHLKSFLSLPLFSPSVPSAPSWGRGTGRQGPTRGVTEKRLPDGQQWNVSLVRGNGVGPTVDHFTSHMGVVSKMYCKIWQKDFAKLPWERTEKIDREMLAHMSAMHRSWHSKKKKRHFNGKCLDDTISSVPAGVDSSDW
ncbi:hypothetical protein Taro_038205 [Colocasia esculenta]|uniref:Uncharacterized protein n=1 Tax=Colocasia esculenta TaxID=4460 RepID=A0A843W623_COLES|nr:hypothetical protein [Colocasia esculenta]